MTIKEKLFQLCMNYADERIKSAEQSIVSAREAAVNDTKSSAGDKYETTREMMQQEISFNQNQLFEARKLKHALSQINPSKAYASVQPGSLVLTDMGAFFISISAGPVQLDGESFFAISPASPAGRALMGSKENQTVRFNGKEVTIKKVL